MLEMIVVTHNIRGGGSVIKKKRIGFLNQSGKMDVCFLHETKLQKFDAKLAEELWGAKEVEWLNLDSTGAYGGLVIL